MSIKKGDRLEVIKGNGALALASIHIAESDQDFGGYVRLANGEGSWLHWRFRVLPPVQETAKAVINTSLEAFASLKLGDSHTKVLQAVIAAGADGITAAEIEQATKIKAHKRLPELKAKGAVKLKIIKNGLPFQDFPETRKVNGVSSRVWVAA